MVNFAINGIISFTSIPLHNFFYWISDDNYINICINLFLIYYIFSSNIPEGWTSIATIQLIFGSVNLFFLGFLGIYIAKIFDEIKSRPKYLIEKNLLKR